MGDVAILNNNEAYETVVSALKQSTGAEDITQTDLQGIVDAGLIDPESREQFTKALLNVIITNIYVDELYEGSEDKPWYNRADEFGAMLRIIDMEIPEAEKSESWADFGTGEGQKGTLGVYDVRLPKLAEQLYGKSVSYEIALTISGQQWDSACHNASELSSLVAYVKQQIMTSVNLHLEQEARLMRNNLMAEVIDYASIGTSKGIHKYDVVRHFVEQCGDPTQALTKEDFMASPECMRYLNEKLRYFSNKLETPSVKYNTGKKTKFTKKHRQVLQVLDYVAERMRSVSYADTYNLNEVKGPNVGFFQTVPYWQADGDDDEDFDTISSINVKMSADGTEVSQTGIVALLADRFACMHTMVNRRSIAKYFEIEDMTLLEHQFVSRLATNPKLCNAIVFTLEDYTPA